MMRNKTPCSGWSSLVQGTLTSCLPVTASTWEPWLTAGPNVCIFPLFCKVRKSFSMAHSDHSHQYPSMNVRIPLQRYEQNFVWSLAQEKSVIRALCSTYTRGPLPLCGYHLNCNLIFFLLWVQMRSNFPTSWYSLQDIGMIQDSKP